MHLDGGKTSRIYPPGDSHISQTTFGRVHADTAHGCEALTLPGVTPRFPRMKAVVDHPR